MISYWAPIADITDTVKLVDKQAETAAKQWWDLHLSVSSMALHTPVAQGGCGLISLANMASAWQAVHLAQRHWQFLASTKGHTHLTKAYSQVVDMLASCGHWHWQFQPTPAPYKMDIAKDPQCLWLLHGIVEWHQLGFCLHQDPLASSSVNTAISSHHNWMTDLPTIPAPSDCVLDVWMDGLAGNGKTGVGIIAPGLSGGDFTFWH